MTHHTPEPWNIRWDWDNSRAFVEAGDCADITDTHSRPVCVVTLFDATSHRDAILIKAAPELLTMLRRVLDEYLMRDPSTGPVSPLTLEQARAAIAKATHAHP